MGLFVQIRRALRRLGDRLHRRLACPRCGSEDLTLTLKEWVIGYQVQDNGRTTFCRLCKSCGHEWKQVIDHDG